MGTVCMVYISGWGGIETVKYNIIYADPPWAYPESGSNPKVHGKHYEMLTLTEICKLPIQTIAADNSALFLWVTMPRLLDGLECMKSWGFTYKTVAFNWIKANKRCTDLTVFDPFMGAGGWTRSNSELCLLGFKGKIKRQGCGVRQVVYTAIEQHSKKPDIVREKIIELCGDLPRVELFARQSTPGWEVWGNEVKSDIDLYKFPV